MCMGVGVTSCIETSPKTRKARFRSAFNPWSNSGVNRGPNHPWLGHGVPLLGREECQYHALLAARKFGCRLQYGRKRPFYNAVTYLFSLSEP